MYVAKVKAQISCSVTSKLICIFFLAYAKSRFSVGAALLTLCLPTLANSLDQDQAQ